MDTAKSIHNYKMYYKLSVLVRLELLGIFVAPVFFK